MLIQKQGEVNTKVLLNLSVTQETIRQESVALRRGLRELKDADPQVKDYISAPVPANLRELYQGGSNTSGAVLRTVPSAPGTN